MTPPLPYRFSEPPARLKKARLDNIALIPASLLPLKNTYQPLANRLPTGSVLCVPGTQRQQQIIALVTRFLRSRGHQVITIPLEKISRRMKKPQRSHAETETLKLAF